MIISFFEEFPSSRVLKKAEHIKFPFNLYLADYSIDSFKLYCKEIKNKNLKKCVWWPLLHKRDGYWISGFARRAGLQRLFSILKNERIPVMLDLEFPIRRWLVLKNLFKFNENEMLIRNFIKNYKGEIYTCEYFTEGKLFGIINFGLDINPAENNTKQIKMFYTSMHRFSDKFLKDEFERNVSVNRNRFIAGLGTIARGIRGDEKVLTPEKLKKDLELCRKAGVSEVVIYRLEGLNEEYLKVIEGFSG